jgi:hypothetical protein
MTPEQFHALQQTVAESIEKNVNGKIRALDVKIDTYIREDLEYNKRMAEDTTEWRAMAEENLKAVADVRSFGKVGMRLLAVVAAIGSAWVIINNWITK